MKLENNKRIPANLILETGERFEGYSFGANENDGGELGKKLINFVFRIY